jgi:hypothetical protein
LHDKILVDLVNGRFLPKNSFRLSRKHDISEVRDAHPRTLDPPSPFAFSDAFSDFSFSSAFPFTLADHLPEELAKATEGSIWRGWNDISRL